MLKKVPKDIKISVVIPLYNEAKTLEKVIKTVHSYPHIYEILAVNDGSTDQTLEKLLKLKKELSKLIVVNQQPNKGKTAAIVSGIKKAKGNLIAMIDADLLTLNHSHLDKLFEDVINHKYEMTILDRGSDRYNQPLGLGAYLFTRPLGGERAFWKKDFLKIPIKGTERYGLETLMNLYYVNNKKKIKSIYCADLESPNQIEKRKSIINGIKNYKNMAKEIIEVGGVSGYIHQTVGLEEDRLQKLYDVKQNAPNKSSKKAVSVIIFAAGILLSVGTFAYLASKHSLNNNKIIKKLKS